MNTSAGSGAPFITVSPFIFQKEAQSRTMQQGALFEETAKPQTSAPSLQKAPKTQDVGTTSLPLTFRITPGSYFILGTIPPAAVMSFSEGFNMAVIELTVSSLKFYHLSGGERFYLFGINERGTVLMLTTICNWKNQLINNSLLKAHYKVTKKSLRKGLLTQLDP